MSFLFTSSHLSEDKRPGEEEEEEEDVQPMQRSGMVRAFSHLPEPGQGAPAALRPFAPAYLPSWATEPEPGSEDEPEADSDTDRHEPEDARLEDHFPEGRSNHDPDPGIAGPAPKKWGSGHDPDPGIAGPAPKAWGSGRNTDPGIAGPASKDWGSGHDPDPGIAGPTQDLRDKLRDGVPATFGQEAAQAVPPSPEAAGLKSA